MDTKSGKKINLCFHCTDCDYYTSKKSNYDKHCLTAKHLMDTKSGKKIEPLFSCLTCDYHTSKKYNYEKHCLSAKHIVDTKSSKNGDKCSDISYEAKCFCGKTYRYQQGLYKHRKACSAYINYEKNQNIDSMDEFKKKENSVSLIMDIIKENQEFKTLLIEQQNQVMELQKENNILLNKMVEISQTTLTTPSIINNNHNNNTTNNQFNLSIFLNETCKNAINFTDFIDNIHVTDDDLENNAKMGFVGGVTKIIIDNLKQLELYDRPIHCTDIKRETIYVKDEDQWEKDASKEVLQKGIQEITRKNMCKLSEWRENNPEYNDMETELGEKSMIMQQTSMAGSKREEFYPKIIKNIAKETNLEKIKKLE
jgi:hypothetical protein